MDLRLTMPADHHILGDRYRKCLSVFVYVLIHSANGIGSPHGSDQLGCIGVHHCNIRERIGNDHLSPFGVDNLNGRFILLREFHKHIGCIDPHAYDEQKYEREKDIIPLAHNAPKNVPYKILLL